jgi:hypothetical protein
MVNWLIVRTKLTYWLMVYWFMVDSLAANRLIVQIG